MEINDNVIEQLNLTLQEIAEMNRQQNEILSELARGQTDPNYRGGTYGSMRILDLLAKAVDKLGQKVDKMGGGAAPTGGLSSSGSHPTDNPAAVAAQRIFTARDRIQEAARYVPVALRQGADIAYDVNQELIQPARRAGAVATGLIQTGELQGLSGAGGDITIPGTNIGVRTPFSEAGMRGLGMRVEAFRTSMQAGITMAQAENIQRSVVNAGYNQGTAGYNALNKTFQYATQMNSLIGQDPRFQEMAISGMRFGGATMQDMIETVKEINDTAGKINIGIGQMLDTSLKYRDLLAQTGGNPAMAGRMTARMAALTGLPPETSFALQNNPFVMARQMQATGLLPWQLGQMAPEERAGTTYEAFDMIARQLGPGGPTTRRTDVGGFTHISTGEDKQDATIAMLMGVDTNVVKQMKRNRGKVMARAEAADVFAGYAGTAERILGGAGSDAEKITRLRAMESGGGRGTLGALREQMKRAGASEEDVKKVMEAGKDIGGPEGHKILGKARAREMAFQEWAAEKSGVEQGGKVMVDLTEEAKKLLKIKNNDVDGKALAGAGIGTVVGGAIGSAVPIPGVGTVAGGLIGGSVGEAIGGIL